jgi:DNA (cytosine-5)-methyltransferase 1
MQLVLSLFPGIDLLGMAFKEEGFAVVQGGDVIFGGDIRTEHYPPDKFDGAIGGPPCQSFSSLSHLVRAQGREPRFGNLIPEYERCVVEAQPSWFLAENVRAAPIPVVPGYSTTDFLLNNAWLLGPDGLGQEQERLRRFTFGVRGSEPAPNLLRWIDLAALMLPEGNRAGSVTQWTPDNTAEAKGRVPAVSGASAGHGRSRTRAVVGSPLGSDESRHPGTKRNVRRRDSTASDGGKSVRMARYTLADALRLQGLPEGFLADIPFRKDAALKAVANGVSLFTGRAIAKAIRCATERS